MTQSDNTFDLLSAFQAADLQTTRTKKPTRPQLAEEPSWFDQTIGSLIWGGADVGQNLFGYIGSWIPGKDPAENIADLLRRFKENNPQYAPIEVDSAYELITNPKALASRISSGLAYLGVTAASLATGGPLLAAGILYAVESKRAYDLAIADGYDEAEATTKAEIVGVISTLLNLIPMHYFAKGFKGGDISIVSSLVDKAFSKAIGLQATGQAARVIATQTVFGMLESSTDDLVSYGLFGKPLPEDFKDKLAQAAIVSGLNAEVLGLGIREYSFLGKDRAITLNISKHLDSSVIQDDVYTKDDFVKSLTKELKMSKFAADNVAAVMDGIIRRFAEYKGIAPQAAWNDWMHNILSSMPPMAQVLKYSPSEVSHMFDKVGMELFKLPNQSMKKGDMLQYLESAVGKDALELTGIGGIIESNKGDSIDAAAILKQAKNRATQFAQELFGDSPEMFGKYTDIVYRQYKAYDEMLDLGSKLARAAVIGDTDKSSKLSAQLQDANTQVHKQFGAEKQRIMKQFETGLQLVDSTLQIDPDEYHATLIRWPSERAKTKATAQELTAGPTTDESSYSAAGGKDRYAVLRTAIKELSSGESLLLIEEASILKAYGQGDAADLAKLIVRDAVLAGHDRIAIVPSSIQVNRPTSLKKPGVNLKALAKWYDSELPVNIVKALRQYSSEAGKVSTLQLSNDAGTNTYKVIGISIDDAAKKAVAKESGTAVQGAFDLAKGGYGPTDRPPRASIVFYEVGNLLKAAIKAGVKPNVSSAIYSMGQIFRTQLEPKDLAVFVSHFGIKRGRWSVDAKDRFAKAFEAYVMEGKAPIADLQLVFEHLGKQVKEVYGDYYSRGITSTLNDQLRNLFDQLFFKDTVPMRTLRLRMGSLSEQINESTRLIDVLSKAKKLLKESSVEATSADAKLASERAKLVELKKQYESAKAELQELKANTLAYPKQPTEAERLAELFKSIASLPDKDTRSLFARKLSEVFDGIRYKLFSMSGVVKKFPAGELFLRKAEDTITKANMLFEPFYAKALDIIKHADRGLLNELATEDPSTGMTLFRMLVEPQNLDPEAKHAADVRIGKIVKKYGLTQLELLKQVKQWASELHDTFGQLYEDTGLLRKIQGKIVPSRKQSDPRLPRILTDRGWEAIMMAQGPVYEALVQKVKELTGKQVEKVEKRFATWRKELMQPWLGIGTIDGSRYFKILPDVVTTASGDRVAVFHTDPEVIMRESAMRQAYGFAVRETFGQGMLKDVSIRDTAEFVKRLGLAKEFGITDKLDSNNIRISTNKLAKILIQEHGFSLEQLAELKAKQIRDLAKNAGVDLVLTNKRVADELAKLNPNKLTDEQKKLVIQYARKLGGIALDDSPNVGVVLPRLWRDFIVRLREETPPRAFQQLLDKYAAEGGDRTHLQEAMLLLQRVPLRHYKRTVWTKAATIISSVFASMQTSLAAIPNAVQTMALLPSLVGTKNFVRAVVDTLQNPKGVEEGFRGLVAMQQTISYILREPGFGAEGIAHLISRGVSEITGQRFLARFNNLVAGQAAKNRLNDWAARGIIGDDVAVAKQLGWTAEEIDLWNRQKLTPEQKRFLEAKTIQNAVGKTQFMLDRPWNKARFEHDPFLKMLFAYNSYAMGSGRYIAELSKQVMDAIKSRDMNQMIPALMRAGTLVGGLYGAGTLGMILRQAIKGDFSKERENELEGKVHAVAGALLEAGLLGPLTTVMSATRYDRGMTELILIGTMPQVNALIDFANVVIGRGRFAEFGFTKRFMEAAKENTPLWQAAYNWIWGAAYPQYTERKKVYQEARMYEEELNKRRGISKQPTPPRVYEKDFYEILWWAERGDVEKAVEERDKKIKEIMEAGGDPVDFVTRLRAALTARSPIRMKMPDTVMFLNSLSEEKRERYTKVWLEYMRDRDVIAPVLRRAGVYHDASSTSR